MFGILNQYNDDWEWLIMVRHNITVDLDSYYPKSKRYAWETSKNV